MQWEAQPWINRFGVVPKDPGYIYLIKDGDRYKIGRSKSRDSRLREARTWLPDMEVIGIKPFWNFSRKEKIIHVGMSNCWYDGEWFVLHDEGHYNALVPEFQAFSDTDINANSVNFIYWINGSGMSEFLDEIARSGASIRAFHRQEAISRKG